MDFWTWTPSVLRRTGTAGGLGRAASVVLAVVSCDLTVFWTGWLDMETVSLVYPTTGVALGLLWLWGWRYWPGVLVGSALTSWYFFGGVMSGGADGATGWALWALVLGTALPDALAAALGAWVLRWREDRTAAAPLSTLSDALRLIVVAAGVSPMLSTVLSVPVVRGLTGASDGLLEFAAVWWVSQLLGNLIVAPLLVVWCRRSVWRAFGSRYERALFLVVLGLAGVCVLSFTGWSLPVPAVFPLAMGLPLLVWVAIGWESRGATLGLMVSATFAVVGTGQGYGVLSALMPLEKLDNLQWGLAALAVTLLPLGAATTERKTQARDLARQRDRLRRLSRQVREVEYRERRELATRLHDGMNQYLAVARLAVEKAQPDASWGAARAAEALRQAEAEGRAVINELAPPALSALGLHAALSGLVRKFESEFDLPVMYDGQPVEARPPAAVEAFLLRCARELLFNVVKHAGASRAGIVYRGDAWQVELTVWDDGAGFDLEKVLELSERTGSGFGLFSIHEQATAMGGRVIRDQGQRGGVKIQLPGYNSDYSGSDSPAGAHSPTVGRSRRVRVDGDEEVGGP